MKLDFLKGKVAASYGSDAHLTLDGKGLASNTIEIVFDDRSTLTLSITIPVPLEHDPDSFHDHELLRRHLAQRVLNQIYRENLEPIVTDLPWCENCGWCGHEVEDCPEELSDFEGPITIEPVEPKDTNINQYQWVVGEPDS